MGKSPISHTHEPGSSVTVNEERWICVSDFADSGPDDRHYTIDRATGEIRFGDGIRGKIPPDGSEIEATYRCGSGASGNLGSGPSITFRWSPLDLRRQRVLWAVVRLGSKGIDLRVYRGPEHTYGGRLGSRLVRVASLWLLRLIFRISPSRPCSAGQDH